MLCVFSRCASLCNELAQPSEMCAWLWCRAPFFISTESRKKFSLFRLSFFLFTLCQGMYSESKKGFTNLKVPICQQVILDGVLHYAANDSSYSRPIKLVKHFQITFHSLTQAKYRQKINAMKMFCEIMLAITKRGSSQ